MTQLTLTLTPTYIENNDDDYVILRNTTEDRILKAIKKLKPSNYICDENKNEYNISDQSEESKRKMVKCTESKHKKTIRHKMSKLTF